MERRAHVLIVEGATVRDLGDLPLARVPSLVGKERHLVLTSDPADLPPSEADRLFGPELTEPLPLHSGREVVRLHFHRAATVIRSVPTFRLAPADVARVPPAAGRHPGTRIASACALLLADRIVRRAERAARRAEVLVEVVDAIRCVPAEAEDAMRSLRVTVAAGYVDLLSLRRTVFSRETLFDPTVTRRLREATISLRGLREVVDVLSGEAREAASRTIDAAMRLLAVVGTSATVANLVFSVYGMNFDPESSPFNMPELRSYYGYPAVLAAAVILAVVTGVLAYARLRPPRLPRGAREALRRLVREA